MNMNNQSEEFERMKKIIKKKKDDAWDLTCKLKELNKDIKNDIVYFESLCNHEFSRECINSGCYTEYAYICKYCKKYR